MSNYEYYQHRIGWQRHVAEPLLQRGVLTIGFSDITNRGFLDTVLREDWNGFEEANARVWENPLRSRYSLWRFLLMPHDARVLVPGPGTFSIYRVEDDCPSLISELTAADLEGLEISEGKRIEQGAGGLLRVGNCTIDLGFFRRVMPEAENVSRYDYADRALTARMKNPKTTLVIGDLKDSIQAALDAYREKTPPSLRSGIMDQMAENLLKMIHDKLNPDKFEALVKWYFERLGATQVDVLSKNQADKEGDADVTAVFEPLRTIFHVQAKLHDPCTTADAWAVEQVNAYVTYKRAAEEEDGYTKVPWVISTCHDFDSNCQELARENSVVLINGMAFARMLLKTGFNGLDL